MCRSPAEVIATQVQNTPQNGARTGDPTLKSTESRRWSWGYVSAIDAHGRTIWIADAHRDSGKRFVVRADELLNAFVELESAVRVCGELY